MAVNNETIHVPVENIKMITKNEWTIIKEVSKGKSNKEIAKDLSFSEGTVRNYLSNILDKLELRDRTQLAIWSISRGEL
ncbi:transcriptional regulator, LuxR family [Lachnospiraceae bacterium oral taxon 082 str. F0431]|nr:transcriptional regulator, LuxR family [Lachnospiraceae bacterium oral taxon 082 str. F0431]